ncbi:MAG: hypothetical protein ACC662_05105, partial [Planctomycetota bacterium]
EAARIRGLEWKEVVPADLLTREQLQANLEKMVAEEIEPEEIERDTRILRRLGLLGPDEDPLAMILEMQREMVAGYYNPKEKKLYLVEGMIGEGQKPVILHELIHALEDQYIDLEKRAKRWKEDANRLFAEKCVEEGSAEHARGLYEKARPEAARAYRASQMDPEMMKRQMEVLRKVPAYMLLDTLLQYDFGPKFVARAVGDDYPGGMKALYEDPPVSQEMLMHPGRAWFTENRDYAQKVMWTTDLAELGGDGWKKLNDLPDGELDLAVYLDFFLGSTRGKLNPLQLMQGKYIVKRAADAAEGWDGGRAYFLEREGAPIIWVQAYVFDTEDDATEAADALLEALKKGAGKDFEGGAFAPLPTEGAGKGRIADYMAPQGRGRLMQRGMEVILVDGVADDLLGGDLFAALWDAAQATTFEKDPRDTYDPARVPDPFADCIFADREKGVGMKLPAEDGWTVEPYDGHPMGVARFSKDAIEGILIAQAMPVTLDMVLPMVEQQLKAQFPGLEPGDRQESKVGGKKGWRYVMDVPGQAEKRQALYVGQVNGKLLILTISAPTADFEDALEVMDEIADAVFVPIP